MTVDNSNLAVAGTEAADVLSRLEAIVDAASELPAPMYQLSSGLTVHLQRVNRLFVYKVRNAARKRFLAAEDELPVPTYSVELAGGEKEVSEHSVDTVKLEPWVNDPDLQIEWADYQSQQSRLQYIEIEAMSKAYILRGVVEEGPSDDWLEEQAYYGIEVLEDPRDCKWAWLMDCSTGWDELVLIARCIQTLPDPVEEAAAAAADGFRDNVGEEAADLAANSQETVQSQ